MTCRLNVHGASINRNQLTLIKDTICPSFSSQERSYVIFVDQRSIRKVPRVWRSKIFHRYLKKNAVVASTVCTRYGSVYSDDVPEWRARKQCKGREEGNKEDRSGEKKYGEWVIFDSNSSFCPRRTTRWLVILIWPSIDIPGSWKSQEGERGLIFFCYETGIISEAEEAIKMDERGGLVGGGYNFTWS